MNQEEFEKEANSVSSILEDILSKEKEVKIATNDLDSDPKGAIPTGILGFDVYCGGGIFPGKIYEICGEESNGKSTLCYSIAAAYQRHDPKHLVMIVETESALDKGRCQAIGMDLNRLIVFETDIVEQGISRIQWFMDTVAEKFEGEAKVLFIWDTIAAASTLSEKERGMNSGGMMEKPRILSEAFRKITTELAKHKCSLILINQVRDAIGGWKPGLSTPGGRAIRHHASVRLMVKSSTPITETFGKEEKVIGNEVNIFMLKNKLAQPRLTFGAVMNHATGFQRIESSHKTVMDMAVRDGVEVKGSWISIKLPDYLQERAKSEIKVQGSVKLLQLMRESLFLRVYMEYLGYKNYASMYPLMSLKYRHTIWEKEVQMIKCWNKDCSRYGGEPLPQDLWPTEPDPVSKEEFTSINKEIILLNEDLD